MIPHRLPNSEPNQRRCENFCYVLFLCVAVSHTSVRSTSLFSFSRKHSEHMLLTRRSALGIFEAPALPYGGREMRFMVERVVQHVRTWSDTQHIKCLKVKYYHENLERAFKSCHPISKRKDLYLNRRGTSGPMDHRCLEPSHVPGKAKWMQFIQIFRIFAWKFSATDRKSVVRRNSERDRNKHRLIEKVNQIKMYIYINIITTRPLQRSDRRHKPAVTLRSFVVSHRKHAELIWTNTTHLWCYKWSKHHLRI